MACKYHGCHESWPSHRHAPDLRQSTSCTMLVLGHRLGTLKLRFKLTSNLNRATFLKFDDISLALIAAYIEKGRSKCPWHPRQKTVLTRRPRTVKRTNKSGLYNYTIGCSIQAHRKISNQIVAQSRWGTIEETRDQSFVQEREWAWTIQNSGCTATFKFFASTNYIDINASFCFRDKYTYVVHYTRFWATTLEKENNLVAMISSVIA